VEFERSYQDQHPGEGWLPKLAWAGSLLLDRAGHQMTIDFLEYRVVLAFTNVLQAWRFRDLVRIAQQWGIVNRVQALKVSHHYTVAIQIGRRRQFEVFPHMPRWLKPYLA